MSTMSLANSGATFAGNLRGTKASAPKVAASKASSKASVSVFQDKDKVCLLVFATLHTLWCRHIRRDGSARGV